MILKFEKYFEIWENRKFEKKFGKNFEIWEKFGNLEKTLKFGNRLEIWKNKFCLGRKKRRPASGGP